MKELKKIIPIWLYLTGGFYLMEALLRLGSSQPFFKSQFLILLLSGVFATTLILLASLTPPKFRRTVLLVLFGLISFYFSAQFIYYQIFRTYFTMYSAMHGGKALKFLSTIVHTVFRNFFHVISFYLPLLGLVLMNKRLPAWKWNWRRRLLFFLIGLVLFLNTFIFSAFSSWAGSAALESLRKRVQIDQSVLHVGLVMTTVNDIRGHFVRESLEEIELPPMEEPTEKVREKMTAPAGKISQREVQPAGKSANVLSIDFKTLSEEETDTTLAWMSEYFGSRTPTDKNDHTGRFAGHNLIFITAESFSHLVVDPDLTPTLYKMATQGYVFPEFYNPVWEVSTSDGEYVAVTGLLPKSGVWSLYRSSNNSLPFTMGNALRRQGYFTMAYHNHYYDFYDRDLSHPNLGYDYKGVGNGLEVTDQWPESDLEMMEVTIDEYIDNEPFHAYYMTVSGHLMYNFWGNAMSYKNAHLVEHLSYSDEARAYLACNIEFDRAMEHLLERLEEKGIAERTLIVISADHYPYGLENSSINELSGHEVEQNFELYKSALIIYEKGMNTEVINRPVSSLDIIPTLHNLMGLPYDSRLLMGTDIFSSANPLVVFLNRSYITRDFRYDASKDAFIGNEPAQWFQEHMSERVDRMFRYSALVLDRDYYGYLEEMGQAPWLEPLPVETFEEDEQE